MRVTEEEYEKLKTRLTRAPAQPKHTPQHEPLEAHGAQETDTSRPVVCITSFTTRLQDPDNCCPKYHIDALRYAGIIKDDRAKDIELFVYQEKVKTKKEERIEIEIQFS